MPPNESITPSLDDKPRVLSNDVEEWNRLQDYEEESMAKGAEAGAKALLERKAREAQQKNPMQDTELSLWARKLREHLKEHRPKEYASLKAAGNLNEVVQERVDQIDLEFSDLLETGLPYNQAMELIRDQLYPPPESCPRM
jgi:hypothetical protein